MLTGLSPFRADPFSTNLIGPSAFPPAGGGCGNSAPAPITPGFGFGDSFVRGGTGTSPCSRGGSPAGQMPEQELAMLVKLLISAMQQQGLGADTQMNNPMGGGCPSSMGLSQPGQMLDSPLGGAQWGNMFPVQGPQVGGDLGGNAAVGGGMAQAPATPGAARALDWSAQQMNPATANAANPNNGLTQGQDPNAWTNWCLAFVAGAYGYEVPELRAATAFDSFQNFAQQGRITQDRNPPTGAPVFFDKTQGTPWGHVGIATGQTTADGDPIIRTTGSPDNPGIKDVPLSQLEKQTATYLGWAKI